MIEPILAAFMMCPMYDFFDYTNLVWTDKDSAALIEMAKHGCKKNNPKKPCLYTFLKVGENKYNVKCGPPVKAGPGQITEKK